MARAAKLDLQDLIEIAAEKGVPIPRPAAGTDAAGGAASGPSSAAFASNAAVAAGASGGASGAAADDDARLEHSMSDEGEGGADGG
jgi:hypothetical protein